MKKFIYTLIALNLLAFSVKAQLASAADCTAAVNVCTSASFSVTSSGGGSVVDFTTSDNISNPTTSPPGVVPPGGTGCLLSGELDPVWMIVNIQTPGTLEFSFGAGPGVQTGYYDWAMWPYNAGSCSGISGNSLAPVRCCWNATSSGGTGCAATANIPAGGNPLNFAPALNVNCGDKYIICFSNYSGVVTSVPLNFFGSAVVSCSSVSNTLAISSASVCQGAPATLSVTSSPGTTYTWTPGNVNSPSITVTPSSTTNYTLNASNVCGTLSGTAAVYVSPGMNLTVNSTNGNCTGTLGSSTVSVGGGSPAYSYTWSPAGGNSSTASGLTTGTYSVTVKDALGCVNTQTTNVVAPAPISFSLNTSTGGTVLACNPPTLTLNAVNTSTLSNVTFTWTSITTGTATGSSITVSAPGVYTVFGQDQTVGSCTDTQTIAISQNTAVPGVTVNPVSGTITCGGGPITFTATSSSTTNITGQWYDPSNNAMMAPSSTPLLMSTGSPGIYSVTFTNTASGCTSTQTVAVSANTIVPTMTINTPNGTNITCSTPCLTLNITASPGPIPKTYVWTNMQTAISSTVPTGGYTVCAPGNYLAQYQDGNNCMIQQQITITIDTVKPAPSAITNLPSNSFTLNCYNPVLTATAVTNPMLPVSSYSWVQPAPSLVVATQTMQVNTISVTANPTTFTVLAMGSNGCVGRSKVLFYEDLVTPVYKVVFTPTALTCSNTDVAVSMQYVSGPNTASNFTITSPPPTTTANASGALFNVPGVYTGTIMLASNGCTAAAQSATVPLDKVQPPITTIPSTVIPCGSPTVNISAGTLTTSTSYSYAWTGPPGAGIGQPGKNQTSVNMPGNYVVSITNTVNGCRSTNVVSVGQGSLNVNFTADPTNGYAPLPVTFVNTSALGALTGTAVVQTSWSYGNGSAFTATATSANSAAGLYNGATTYSAAGVYTVMLYMTQNFGTASCAGTASAVITVDLPSKLVIPNVFTPNEDGVNDRFMVNSTNITDISCLIYDRWGVKMYDVTSSTGNISWDGKNLSGKEVPSGTYFYIIKAKGKDEIPYEQKGTVSLFR